MTFRSRPLSEQLEPRLMLAGELAGYELVVADLGGNPIVDIEQGQSFQLIAYTHDLRASGEGVFAGYLDVTYDGTKVHPTGSPQYGASYPNGRSGDTGVSGLLDEMGGFAGFSTLGSGSVELFRQTFMSDATGGVTFAANIADTVPMHNTLLYGVDDPLLATEISFGSVGVEVLDAAGDPPTAVLADPANGTMIDSAVLNGRHYLDVTYAAAAGTAIDADTITDAGAEFTLSGAGVNGVVVDGAAVLVSGTTYRYTFAGSFVAGAVTVDFTAASFADGLGQTNVAASEGFTVNVDAGYEIALVSNVPLSFLTDDNDTLTVTLKGGGAGTVHFAHAPVAGKLPDPTGIVLTGTNTKSTLDIAAKTAIKGQVPEGTLNYLTVHGPLSKFTAPAVDFIGGAAGAEEAITFDNSVGTFTVRNVSGGHTLTIGPRVALDLKTAVAFTAAGVENLSVDSDTPVNTITVVNWLDTDATADLISAPSIGTLKTLGNAKALPAVAGDFQADVTTTTGAVTTFSAAGAVTDSTWNVAAGISNFTVLGATAGSDITCAGVLAKMALKAVADLTVVSGAAAPGGKGATTFTAGSVQDTSLTFGTPVSALTVVEWLDTDVTKDQITAPSIGTAKATGAKATKLAAAIRGDFQSNIEVTNAAAKASLGTLTVLGWLENAQVWSAGIVNAATFGGIRNSLVYAGVDPALDSLPTAVGRFQNQLAAITKLEVKGIAGQASSFVGSQISAWKLGTIILRNVDGDNTANAHAAVGVTGHQITKSYTRYAGGVKQVTLPAQLGPSAGTLDSVIPDFVVQLV